MLRNNDDVRRCSYFELGLLVIEHDQIDLSKRLMFKRQFKNQTNSDLDPTQRK